MTVDKGAFPPDMDLHQGDMLELRQPDGDRMVAMVTDVSDDSVTLDANHPLAGKDLIFDVKLAEIEPRIIQAS
jgi:peptidylprolyl isomerase